MTIVHATPYDFRQATIDGPKRVAFERGLFSGAGTIESPAIEVAEPFDNLVGSFNADVPKGSSVELDVQARVGDAWTGWYQLVEWTAEAGGRSLGEQKDEHGFVDIDTLKLDKPAAAFRYRIRMKGKPTLRRVAATVVDIKSVPSAKPFEKGPWVREIELAARSQMEEQEKYKHDICSPTSLSMVLERWGRKLSTVDTAELVLDHSREKVFGNWPLNVQAAATQGFSGEVSRLNGLEDVQAQIAAGRPVIASVTIHKGDLSASPERHTKGHLLVIAGFTASGDVISYDPAALHRDGVRRIYPRKEFEKIWLERKLGAAYLLGPRFPEEFRVAVTTDLRRSAMDHESYDPHDAGRESQLIEGQRVRALAAKGDWVKVEALDQPYWNGKDWQGYPGWIRADALTSAPGPAPTSVAEPSVDKILKAARPFLGLSYVWGGLSKRGVDCSGLVYWAYRSEGLELPRDARDQFRRAAKIKRSELRPGDLVFLTKPGKEPDTYHVMVYEGGDSLIESRSKGGTLETTFQERFGKPLSAIETGDLVDNLKGSKPPQVRIDFGSFLHR